MLFILNSTIFSPYALIDIEKFRKIYYDFFIKLEGDGKFLNFTTIKFKAQEGFTKNNIREEDFLNCSTPLPVFSERFVRSVSKELVNDLQFYPCTVVCDGNNYNFFIGKILRYELLINEELSDYRLLCDGTKIISRVKYNEKIKNEEIFIARDIKELYIFLVNENFKHLIESKGLNIKFKDVT